MEPFAGRRIYKEQLLSANKVSPTHQFPSALFCKPPSHQHLQQRAMHITGPGLSTKHIPHKQRGIS